MLSLVAAGLAAFALAALALLHVYWARGGRWPAEDEVGLVHTVVGATKDERMPGPLACLAVAAALAVAALLPLVAAGLVSLPLPPGVARGGTLLAGAVLGLRGALGFFEGRFRPAVQPYARLNRRLYSPLALWLAALLVAAAL
ncbi:MAG: DUF3995 domain-containing protein [Myxococcota bacterium]